MDNFSGSHYMHQFKNNLDKIIFIDSQNFEMINGLDTLFCIKPDTCENIKIDICFCKVKDTIHKLCVLDDIQNINSLQISVNFCKNSPRSKTAIEGLESSFLSTVFHHKATGIKLLFRSFQPFQYTLDWLDQIEGYLKPLPRLRNVIISISNPKKCYSFQVSENRENWVEGGKSLKEVL